MSKNLYMHTINSRPAIYTEGEQITYFDHYNRVKFSDVFVDSLEKIKSQQRASAEWRDQHGYGNDLPSKYGYVRIVDDRS